MSGTARSVSVEDDQYDDYDGHMDNPIDQVDQKNDIAKNDDFIAFSNSSEEELSDQEGKAGEAEEDKKILQTDYPWIIDHDHSKQPEIADWLTLEVIDFVSYISPNKAEIEARNKTISNVRAAVKEHWPDADLHVFGSYATDLYLPGSDIDCVVNSKSGDKESRNSLYSLASFLKQKNLATEIEIIAKARVPIIKFVEPSSKIHIDVSFERTNGLEAAKLIRNWLDTTPGLRELVLIVKQFLHSRRLNDVHTGGLGGFSIIVLVFSFLRLHPRIIAKEINPKNNLGVLLIDFFELYGKNFGYDHVALSVKDSMARYLPKAHWRDLQQKNAFTLAIQDPGDASNNISRGSFNLRDIKKAFAGAFDLLSNRCFELDKVDIADRKGLSILGNVIQYRGRARDFKDERNLVENKAIVENELYHRKRSRIIHDSNEDQEDDNGNKNDHDISKINENDNDNDSNESTYEVKEPSVKRQKKSLSKKPHEKNPIITDNDDNDDDYNPLEQ